MSGTGTVRVGFVGFGSRSLSEVAKLVGIEGVEIVAAYDVADDAIDRGLARLAKALGDGHRVPAPKKAASVAELLEHGLDVVYVSVPPHAHGEVEHSIIDAGVALVVEKPVANELRVALDVLAHLHERPVINAVAFQWRYSDAVDWACVQLEGRQIGMVMCNRVSSLPGSSWWRRIDQGGGMLAEQHIHTLDLARLLAGDVASVFSAESYKLFDSLPAVTVPDSQVTVGVLRRGGVLSLANACTQDHWEHQELNRVVQVVADGATLDVSARRASLSSAGGELTACEATVDENLQLNKAVVAAVAGKDQGPIRSDYEDGLKTTVVALAAREAARLGKPARISTDQLGWSFD